MLLIGGGIWFTAGRSSDERVPLASPIGPIVLDAASPDGLTYVGGANCRDCHQDQYDQWRGSHHDRAMQYATEKTVLGDFDNAIFTHRGVESSFYRNDGKFFVRTEGEDGKMHEYLVLYTFGFTPLQQYLVAFPGGRLQTLPLCWDARPMKDGGQRWFHIYGQQRIAPGDPLFWTGPNQNWNFMCAECHSTHLRKNYDPAAQTYRTSWSQVNVSCEACHGPGSAHVQWARDQPLGRRYPINDDKGLAVRLRDLTLGAWQYNPGTGFYQRTTRLASRVQTETCARCHALRGTIEQDYVHGRSIHDTHQVDPLLEQMYYADGQIHEEVYVYGSFVQSRMYHAGVRCVDCHNPHSGKLLRKGNQTCTQCHDPGRYQTAKHHFHEKPGPGTRCVDCHMIQRTYMQVDPRRDHSFRIPRPDLTAALHTPNACNDCHDDQSATWSADHINQWYGPRPRPNEKPHFAYAIDAARKGLPDAADMLKALVVDPDRPPIVRAAALSQAANVLTPALLRAAIAELKDPDPMVRRAALGNLRVLSPAQRWQYAAKTLTDPIRSVRLEAALVLAAGRKQITDATVARAFDAAAAEYERAQRQNFDRASGHFAMGLLHTERGQLEAALAAYRKALALEPWYVPAAINYAQIQRQLGHEQASHAALTQCAEHAGDVAGLRYELGMSYVRRGEMAQALEELRRAAELDPQTPRLAYGYAIALHSAGQSQRAIEVLGRSAARHPHDRQTLFALATLNRDRGELAQARDWAEQLVRYWPNDESGRTLLESLQRNEPAGTHAP